MPLKSGGAVDNEYARGRAVCGLQSAGKGVLPYSPEFYDGLESGDLSKFDETYGVQVITSPVHHGTYAVGPTGAGGLSYLKHLIASPVGTYFVRCLVKISSYAEIYSRALIDIYAGVNILGTVSLEWDGSKRVLGLTDYLANFILGTTELIVGWHCIIFEISKGTGAVLNVWLDDLLEITTTCNNPDVDIDAFAVFCDYDGTLATEIDCIIGDDTNPTCTYYDHLGV